MNYSEQQRFLKYSLAWGAFAGILVTLLATLSLYASGTGHVLRLDGIAFSVVMLAIVASLSYTPDYLHITVSLDKRWRWQIRVRWRILAVALLLAAFSITGIRDALVAFAALAWLAGANLLAKKFVRPPYAFVYFWVADFVLAGALLVSGRNILLGAALLAAAAHLGAVTCEKRILAWSIVVAAFSCAPIFLLARGNHDITFLMALTGVLLVSVWATALLVHRAQQHNRKNTGVAIDELTDFTKYSADQIWRLWSISNQQLASSWQKANLAETDPEKMAAWYRENSEFYLFAISAYNLEYKRIRSNLKVLRLARGSCLDYGAGNGELLLEIARRGQHATYYDVNGETLRFARWRAQRRNLAIDFFHSKNDLRTHAQKCGLDTIFCFDVLEHLPDLPGELDFLSSLLSPGGRMIFDVPAGATKAHPMHLNHSLNVRAHLQARGLKESRSLLQKLPFRKEEKYFFQAKERSPSSPQIGVAG